MKPLEQARFDDLHQSYINELILQGKSPKTIDCYSRCLRQVAEYFDAYPESLSIEQLKIYFLYLVKHKSWIAGKITRNAIQYFYPINWRENDDD